MVVAMLLIPATTWWVAMRHYHARRQVENTPAMTKKEQEPRVEAKPRHDRMPARIPEGSLEFGPAALRTSWNGQTDPDGVWYSQRREASQTLVRFGLPAQETGYGGPAPRRIQVRQGEK